jgi:glycosyltransferase involved in cell wall biosynthesis
VTAIPPRILVLVEHEPSLDPRVGWVAAMCAELARTDVIAVAFADARPRREYDGRLYVERADPNANAALVAKAVAVGVGAAARVFRPLAPAASAAYRAVHASALHRRGRAASVPPRVVVCHDLATLPAGVALKRRFGARLLYDTHEYWPQANREASALEERLTEALERRLVRVADAVVTVSPQLARHLERTYGLPRVLVAPNAVPFGEDVTPSAPRRDGPVRFLLQGRVPPGRGVEELLEAWEQLALGGDAELVVRAPLGADRDALAGRYGDSVVFADPVAEELLVQAASGADVGLIPYGGDNLNHRYASPNKLAQYMHAGLAVVAQRSEFVAEILARYDCGLVYDDAASLGEALQRLLTDRDLLARLKERAYDAARREFNWEVQASAYRGALEELLAD